MDKIIVSEKFLDDAISKHARTLVGTCMKRFEVLDTDADKKKATKELIYESFRNFKELLKSYTCGLEFVSKPTGAKRSE